MRVLILGGSGYVGRNLVRYFSLRHKTAATHRSGRSTFPNVPGVSYYHLDGLLASPVSGFAGVLSCCGESIGRPDVAINAIGLKDVAACEQDPHRALQCNAVLPLMIAGCCKSHGIPFIQISTDRVFDGVGAHEFFGALGLVNAIGDWVTPRPKTVYGRTKYIAEQGVLLAGGIVVRTAGLYGPGFGLIEHAKQEWANGRPVMAWGDARYSPTYIGNFAASLEAIATAGTELYRAKSTLHAVDDVNCTREDFLKCYAEVFGYDQNLVLQTRASEAALVPPNVAMLPSQLRGLVSQRLQDAMLRWKADMETGEDLYAHPQYPDMGETCGSQ